MECLVGIKFLEHGQGLSLPKYQTSDAAGVDIAAAVPTEKPVVIAPGECKLVPSGFSMELPQGYEAQIRPRSGLALKHGITILNSPGTIDADYRGEVGIIMINFGQEHFVIERGMRIAQMVVAPVTQAQFKVVDELADSQRGEGGFGSSGV